MQDKRGSDNKKNTNNRGFSLLKSNAPHVLLECKESVTRVVISTSCKTDQCIIYVRVLKLFLFISIIFMFTQGSLKLYEKLIKEFFNTKIRGKWKETEGQNILVSRSNQVIQFGEDWLI